MAPNLFNNQFLVRSFSSFYMHTHTNVYISSILINIYTTLFLCNLLLFFNIKKKRKKINTFTTSEVLNSISFYYTKCNVKKNITPHTSDEKKKDQSKKRQTNHYLAWLIKTRLILFFKHKYMYIFGLNIHIRRHSHI